MRIRTILLGLAAVLAAFAGIGAAEAQRGYSPFGRDWELLGTQTVDFGTDRDVVRVGREDGRFTALRFRARNQDVHFIDVKVTYGNGETEHLRVDRVVRAETDSGSIDLRGDARFIKDIEMTYRSRPDRRGGHAVVEVFGRHARDGRGGPVADHDRGRGTWEMLGERAVEFKTDRDVIPVGRREGRFTKIRLKVLRHDIDLLSLRVVYANGQEDEYRIDRRVRNEEEGVTFDLRGERRSIDRVIVVARTRLNLGGQAKIQIWGYQ